MIADPYRVDVSHLLPAKLSPSSIEKFKQCPKLYYFTAVLGIRTPGTEHTFRGTLCHTAFEYVVDLSPAARTPAATKAFLMPAVRVKLDPYAARDTVECDIERDMREREDMWADLRDEGSKAERRAVDDAVDFKRVLDSYGLELMMSEMEDLVDNWFTIERIAKLNPVGREVHLDARVGAKGRKKGTPIHGYVDRLDYIEPKDMRVISDYKTGKVPSARYAADKLFQLEVYALLLRELEGPKATWLRLIYVKGTGAEGILDKMVTDAELDVLEKKLEAMWKAINTYAKDNSFPTTKQRLCDWCDFQTVCPEFGGVSGELPQEQALLD